MTAEPPPRRETAPAARIAWFSPMPPSSSGIAAYSAEVLPLLRARGLAIDVYVATREEASAGDGRISAADFVWRHRRAPYDLVVYQLGNAACHDFMWGYLFRYPGLVVLHDAQVHQARAQSLLAGWTPRRDDYLREFAATEPDAPADVALLVAEGLGGSLFGHWPFVRLLLQAARRSVVHSEALATRLTERYGVAVGAIPMGVADPLEQPGPLSPLDARSRHGLGADDLVIGAFGGLTPEKRLPQVIDALAALAPDHLNLHLLLVGAPASHYDALAYARQLGVAGRVRATGFVADADLPAYLRAADICTCLRWPTNGETSASWLRLLAAGRATVITDLAHQPEVPVVDARAWPAAARPVAVAVPILDEANAMRAAIQVLARSPKQRAQLGAAARAFWQAGHTLTRMADAYVAAIEDAMRRPAPRPALPDHLRITGGEQLERLLAPFDVAPPAGVAGAS